MQLSELIGQLEEFLDQNGDMVVQLDSGQPVHNVDFVYPADPVTGALDISPEAIVIK
ncbi:hypothetical protein [Paenirhodobacter populi]|uniref:hypothetical protein n=1 Tax=Paenirhodobacter populi TaxID=2306993 RepID=UPI0013E3780E|nr:hypothetical protein [Sinirhodobacter populi]